MATSEAFEAAARVFIASRASPCTRVAYEEDLAKWLGFCGQQDASPVLAGLEHTSEFRLHLEAEFAPSSVRRILASLSAIYRYLSETPPYIVRGNPFGSRSLPRPPSDEYVKTEAVPASVAEKMIEAALSCSRVRDAAVLRLLYDTGLRRSSVASMRREKIFKRGGSLVARVIIKGGQEVEVTIPVESAKVLERWLEDSDPDSVWVFPQRSNRKPILVGAINQIVLTWATVVGEEGVTPHQFRAAFITSAYDSGMRERDIQAAVHHKNPQTTQRYDRGVRGQGVTSAVSEFRKKDKVKP